LESTLPRKKLRPFAHIQPRRVGVVPEIDCQKATFLEGLALVECLEVGLSPIPYAAFDNFLGRVFISMADN
jgi:hypothetical protein